ncbi:flagellar biosynthesis protein FlhB [Zavarzinia compransoris]|uniref:Flagellar biosynthetic protein FlhB n=1 Tax=Zavarzinia compransoris TaxID=1264899 RepID=A0A317E056_9PROT|nr:flagellar biosynthesis protein FlhB [Zavarzinia compransoris]PWR19814.1 flagellar biosynthesis protein FlhB [Zavarzinia compransoris]TDP45081.1 flagellar biosynthetic protein FlhB [Zavarzinia compransoris]
MAEDQDDSSKTEEPSAKRLQDAEKRGDLLKSAEIGHWFGLAAGLGAIVIIATVTGPRIGRRLAGFLDHSHAIPLDGKGGVAVLAEVGGDLIVGLGLPLLLLVVAAIAGHAVQHKIIFSAEKMKPDLAKLSPIKGLGRIFSRQGLMEFAKGIAKITAVGAGATIAAMPTFDVLVTTPHYELTELSGLILRSVIRLFGGALVVLAVIAGADYLFQRFERLRRLRMTKQEVKDEHKQSEGDPEIKGRQRQMARARMRRRMMAQVPTADVVVTNPTHFAVALKYDSETMGAPRVVAKGVDSLAARIRKAAEDASVPLVENPPLARALYAAVEVDDEVPPEHYKAVAEVIGFVLRRRGTLPKRA